jgi:Protein of unknown function (DUF4019)
MVLSFFRAQRIALGLLTAGLTCAPAFAVQAPQQPVMHQGEATVDPHTAEEQAAQRQALGFLGYLDHGRYADSYAYTGMLIRTSTNRESFAEQIKRARAGTGAMQSRNLIDASYATSMEGAPDGEYVVLHYATTFATRGETVETLTLAFAKGYWRVSGYYIK